MATCTRAPVGALWSGRELWQLQMDWLYTQACVPSSHTCLRTTGVSQTFHSITASTWTLGAATEGKEVGLEMPGLTPGSTAWPSGLSQRP